MKCFHEQIGGFFKSNESVQVFAWKKERNCLGTAIEEREGTCELSWSNCVAKGKRGKNIFNFNKVHKS